jgi:hypothetical protein
LFLKEVLALDLEIWDWVFLKLRMETQNLKENP